MQDLISEDPNVNPMYEPWNGTDKYALMGYITLGYVMTWFIVGVPLAFYVRVQTIDHSQKSSYCQ